MGLLWASVRLVLEFLGHNSHVVPTIRFICDVILGHHTDYLALASWSFDAPVWSFFRTSILNHSKTTFFLYISISSSLNKSDDSDQQGREVAGLCLFCRPSFWYDVSLLFWESFCWQSLCFYQILSIHTHNIKAEPKQSHLSLHNSGWHSLNPVSVTRALWSVHTIKYRPGK